MSNAVSDALVIFGATGDLAHKKIFPALQGLVRRGRLDAPVIGVARKEWGGDEFQARVRDSLERHGGVDAAAFARLSGLLRYVRGDYNEPATFRALCQALGDAERPTYYLAIPPTLFGTVVEQLATSGCTRGGRVIVEKPFGRDLVSARELNRILRGVFDEADIFRIDHYLGKNPVQNLVYFRFVNSFLEPIWNRQHIDHVQITMAEEIDVQGRGAFYEEAGALRDVVENHVFQILTNLTMEPPVCVDCESARDERVKVLKAIPPLDPASVVRGQYRGYATEKGVAPNTRVETFAALRLEINNWRWQGVPFYLRAGKCLPVSCTEVYVQLRRPPEVFALAAAAPNYFRFRVSPYMEIALGAQVKVPGEEMAGGPAELLALREPKRGEPDAYEHLLGEAMRGDAMSFARQDYVEEAWRIVTPVLRDATPPRLYEPGTWGPPAPENAVTPPGGWRDPESDAGAD